MPGPFDLTGRVALITGGNGGIGLGMARGLAKAGADIAIAARNRDKMAAAVAELTALGVRCEALEIDVADTEACRAMVETTQTRLGRRSTRGQALAPLRKAWVVTAPDGG